MTDDASIFRGLSAFPLTPANADGVVDTEAFAIMIDRLAAAGVDSIAVLGSTGTYAFLDRSERSRALAAAVETVAGDVPLIAGIGAMRTSWVKELARDAERLGADGLLLAPVSYAPLTQDEVFAHFDATAAATGLRICIDNNPSTTHSDSRRNWCRASRMSPPSRRSRCHFPPMEISQARSAGCARCAARG